MRWGYSAYEIGAALVGSGYKGIGGALIVFGVGIATCALYAQYQHQRNPNGFFENAAETDILVHSEASVTPVSTV